MMRITTASLGKAFMQTTALMLMLLGASSASGADAQAFRQEAIHRARIAHALARRDMLERQSQQQSTGACGDSYFSAIGCAIQQFFGGVANTTAGVAKSAYHAISVDSPGSAEQLVESALGEDNKQGICIGSLCGFSLLFTVIWVVFALVMIVVYIKDKSSGVTEPPMPVEVEKRSEHREAEKTEIGEEPRASRHPMVLRRRPAKTLS